MSKEVTSVETSGIFTEGSAVGCLFVEGKALGAGVGGLDGEIERASEGKFELLTVGFCEGDKEGTTDGDNDGFSLSIKQVPVLGSFPGS